MNDVWASQSHAAPRRDPNRRILVGEGVDLARAAAAWPVRQLLGLVPIAATSPAAAWPPGDEPAAILGGHQELPRIVAQCGAEEVVVVVSPADASWLADLVTQLAALPVRVRLLPAPAGPVGEPAAAVARDLLEPSGTFWQRCYETALKRPADLALGSVALVLCAPLLLLIALAIKFDTPGPAIFRQWRVGRGGLLFPMLKFRSMTHDATGRPGPKRPHDDRVTRMGHFIRRTSLDELPQLLNVIRGEMTLVGPRPEVPELMPFYTPDHWRRFTVPQGMTGWWQVNGRAEKPIYLDPGDDLYYVAHYSPSLDLLILLKTIGAVIHGRGAF